MASSRDCKKKKIEHKKNEKVKNFLNIDLCACSCAHQLRCDGVCRKSHTNPKTREVECVALYQIDRSIIKQDNKHRSKRTWRYGSQKEGNENKQSKYQRHKKIEKDKLSDD